MSEPLQVLVVDDSPTSRALLVHIVNHAPDMHVLGEARNGRQAVKMVHDMHPDLVLMDVVMPDMDGLAATQEIMYSAPTPIVLVTASLKKNETDIAFQALSLGALALHRKPDGPGHPEYDIQVGDLISKIRLMAGVRVIRHWKNGGVSTSSTPVANPAPSLKTKTTTKPEIVGIVSSTGGPAALNQIVQGLPPDFPLPIVIVQHISADFISSLVKWIGHNSPLNVTLAQEGQTPQPGYIYLAPDRVHLRLNRSRKFELDNGIDPTSLHVPSGNVLLGSIASSYGAKAVGIVLTGIGDDGARGLREMYDAGAFTIAQDEATSVVFGMPKAAAALGAVCQVLPLSQMAEALILLSQAREVVR